MSPIIKNVKICQKSINSYTIINCLRVKRQVILVKARIKNAAFGDKSFALTKK